VKLSRTPSRARWYKRVFTQSLIRRLDNESEYQNRFNGLRNQYS